MWVLTYEVHEYDQYGEYFLCVFLNKPSVLVLEEALQIQEDETKKIAHTLLSNGECEEGNTTYYLREVEPFDEAAQNNKA